MQQFKQYISENNKGLTIFDIDDTMFKTKARVQVIKNGKVIKILPPKAFNTYTLGKGESYDFGQFKSADLFNKTCLLYTSPSPRDERLSRMPASA